MRCAANWGWYIRPIRRYKAVSADCTLVSAAIAGVCAIAIVSVVASVCAMATVGRGSAGRVPE